MGSSIVVARRRPLLVVPAMCVAREHALSSNIGLLDPQYTSGASATLTSNLGEITHKGQTSPSHDNKRFKL